MNDKYCDNCVYCGKFANGTIRYCNYLCATDNRRPCPPGEGCTVKIVRKVYRRKTKEVC